MPVDFDRVDVGQEYTRPELAALWGYAGFEALSRGVVTPQNTPFIILFITREKQESLMQYEDNLENGILDIEGETNHAADDRIIRSMGAAGEIHLFYRDRHHMPFTYYGEIHLLRHQRNTEAPSRFTFRVPSEHPDDSLQTELITHGQPSEEFIPDEEGRRVIRLHVSYERSPRNRARALELHGHRCMACGLSFDERYGPTHARGFIEVHHVRSITEVSGPVNPRTDLIPLCSNCHSMAHRERGRILSLQGIRELLRGSA